MAMVVKVYKYSEATKRRKGEGKKVGLLADRRLAFSHSRKRKRTSEH